MLNLLGLEKSLKMISETLANVLSGSHPIATIILYSWDEDPSPISECRSMKEPRISILCFQPQFSRFLPPQSLQPEQPFIQ